jgi:hypothetical protein
MKVWLLKLLSFTLISFSVTAIYIPASYAAMGDVDSSMYFNGTSTTFQVADASSLDISNAITMEAWVKPVGITTSANYMVMNKESSYELWIVNGYWNFALNGTGGGWTGVNTGIAALVDQWQHIAVVREANKNAVSIYFNGAFTDTETADSAGTGALYNSTFPFQIGSRSSAVGSGFNTYFKGEIDEVRLFNVARTADEIATDMITYGPVNATGLVLYADFNEYSGTTLNNRSTSASAGPATLTAYGTLLSNTSSIETSTVVGSTKITSFLRTYLSANGWKIPTGISSVRILLVGGGGGGGSDEGGGGGGGGFLEYSNFAVTADSYVNVDVGGGGAGALDYATVSLNRAGNNGAFSKFGSLIALGGGGGGSGLNTNLLPTRNGTAGGSGGGGGGEAGLTAGTGGAGTPGQGNSGGSGLPGGTSRGGGGGGAGEIGNTDGNSAGGDGLSSAIANGTTAVFYAGGGGGGGGNSGSGVTVAADGGGGVGGGTATISTDGEANTGGGGGGGASSWRSYAGFAGGSGIVIISYSAFSGSFDSVSSATYRTSRVISVNVSVAGKVSFFAQGKSIPGCIKVPTVTSGSISASCTWIPSQRGQISITAKIYPNATPGSPSSLNPTSVFVTNRTGKR